MKRFTCAFLVLIMLCTALASCQSTVSDDSSAADVSAEESEVERTLFSNLPDVNYAEGDTPVEFTVLTIGDWSGRYKSVEVCPHEESAELIQDSVVARNRLVEDKFGVKITEVRTKDTSGMLTEIRSQATSGDDSYDAVMPYMTDAATLSMEGLFYDLLDSENTITFDGEWWDQSARDTLSIDGRLFFITGDLNLLAYDCTHCMVFNRDMAEEYDVDPYSLVRSDEWTLDKLLEITRKVTTLNNDGVEDFEDIWGCMINSNFTTSMFLASGERLTDKNADGMPEIAVMGDRQVTVFNKIFDLCNDAKVCHLDSSANIAKYPDVWLAASQAVANKRTLFRAVSVVDIFEIAELDCSYGVLPVPKAEVEQDKYYSNVSAVAATCVAIPKTNKNFEMACVILDAMAQASTDTVKSAYYDNVLKLRKLQDDADEEMLDIIFGNRVYDYGILFQWGGINTFMNNIAFSGSNSFQSEYESIANTIEAAIEKTIEGMR